jgi:hypothetical protein
MDNKYIKSILQNALEDQIPESQINLLPAVQARLAERNKPIFQQGENLNKLRIRKLIFFTIAIIALLAVTLITPQGRAFAQTLFRFFSPAKSESFPLSDEQLNTFDDISTLVPTFVLSLEPVSSPENNEPIEAAAIPLPTSSTAVDILKNCTDSSVMLTYNCQIAVAESQAGFDAYEFPIIPGGLSFLNAQSNVTLQIISIHYGVVEGGGYFTLIQGKGDVQNSSTSTWGSVLANAIEPVKIGQYYGEFVQGQFVVYPGATSATWKADAAVVRLRWSDGDRWYSLEKQGDTAPIEYMDKQFLIDLAASLVKSPSSDASTSLASGYSLSISEAETSTGFDLLEPYILPEGYEFAYARYDSLEQTVMLFYLPKDQSEGVGGLYIMETPRHPSNEIISCEECPAGAEELVQVNGMPAYYLQGSFYTGSSDQPLSTPIWQADDPNYSLTWATDKLVIKLNYTLTEWYPGQITKDDLIKIAESMR